MRILVLQHADCEHPGFFRHLLEEDGHEWVPIELDEGETAEDAALREVLPMDAVGFAQQLYAALHRIGASGCAVAFVERLPDDPAWQAVADRLRRAGL